MKPVLCLILGVIAGMVPRTAGAAPHAKSADPTLTLDLGGGVTMTFVRISSGSFTMGSPPESGDQDETPDHKVTLTRAFYLGSHEVTQQQWVQLMGSNPSHFRGPALPVDSVSWNDCQRFLATLHDQCGHRFALPTEAQWEYACRAGTSSRWAFGDQPEPLADYAWFQGNSNAITHPVGRKKPNPWGIYDLYGNVGEWCSDWYANPYPSAGEAIDPTGPATGSSRVIRGGAWGDDPINVRSAYRNANGPDGANDGIGFRCVMTVDPPAPARRSAASPAEK